MTSARLQNRVNFIMQKLLMVALAIIMLSTAAFAEEKSITLTCSNDVEPGTLVLTNPPKVNCDDFETVKNVIGMGITVGPNADVTRMIQEARKVEQETQQLEESNETIKHPMSDFTDSDGGTRKHLTAFDKRFPGSIRNREFFKDVDDNKCVNNGVQMN